ncbi:hypothetical protein ACDF64_10000 [Agromyces sp. MMS24-JH15]|uniref:hypothetical protein n=1 Tax=Agromyces sp. MMS24-JH15 TaxID=3243765 RepID=UPI003748683B
MDDRELLLQIASARSALLEQLGRPGDAEVVRNLTSADAIDRNARTGTEVDDSTALRRFVIEQLEQAIGTDGDVPLAAADGEEPVEQVELATLPATDVQIRSDEGRIVISMRRPLAG